MYQKHGLSVAVTASLAMHIAGAALVYWFTVRSANWSKIEVSGKVIPEPINIDFAEMAKVASRRVLPKQVAVPAPAPERGLEPEQAQPPTPGVPTAVSQVEPQNDLEAVDGAMDGEGTVDPNGKRRITFEQYVRWVRSHNPAIEYPRMARLRGDQGKVVMLVVVPSRGSPPSEVRVESGSGSEILDDAAKSAVLRWSFPPFRGRDEIVLRIPYRFVLD